MLIYELSSVSTRMGRCCMFSCAVAQVGKARAGCGSLALSRWILADQESLVDCGLIGAKAPLSGWQMGLSGLLARGSVRTEVFLSANPISLDS